LSTTELARGPERSGGRSPAAPTRASMGSLPAFVDAASCTAWLEDVPLLNLGAANVALSQQIDLFTAFECTPETRAAVLEVLRPAVLAVQREHAKRFRGKQLPLTPVRRDSLLEVARLWDVFARAWEACVADLPGGPTGASRLLAKACHRAMDAVVRKTADFHYAYVQAAPEDFTVLHRLYLTVERAGLSRHRVRDPLGTGEPISCTQIYLRGLLFEAAMPREHRPQVLPIIETWIDRWLGKVHLLPAPPARPRVPPLIVDLDQPGGARRSNDGADRRALRYLDMGSVALSLEKRIQLLRQGRRPEDAGLDPTLSPREGESLFVALHLQWCGGRIRRLSERHAVDAPAWVSTGIAAAHFYISKRPFEQPGGGTRLDGSAAESSDRRIRAATDYMRVAGIIAEQWLVRDESLGGIGLVRPANEIGSTRLAHGQLVSVRVRGRAALLLGAIRWLQEVQDGGLHVGVQLLAGTPVPVALTRTEGDRAGPALALPAVAALQSPSSLLVVPGTFDGPRIVEIHDHERTRVQLTGLLESGADFERVAFVPCMERTHE